MRISFRNPVILLLALTGVALACSGTTYRLKGEEIRPGVYRVLSTTGMIAAPGIPDRYDSVGVSRMSDFWDYYQNLLADNDLVFFARIDSVIGSKPASMAPWDTVIPGLVPDIVLENHFPQVTVAFYAHVVVDSIIKGSLPFQNFWVKGFSSSTTCGLYPWVTKTGPFLNFSDRLDSVQDFKFTAERGFCANCPSAHLFDGRYLQSPRFPVLKLDITQPYVEIPDTLVETGLKGSVARQVIPWRRDFKSYKPDGRMVNPTAAPKSPVPLLR